MSKLQETENKTAVCSLQAAQSAALPDAAGFLTAEEWKRRACCQQPKVTDPGPVLATLALPWRRQKPQPLSKRTGEPAIQEWAALKRPGRLTLGGIRQTAQPQRPKAFPEAAAESSLRIS